jgi:hypothetical protein
MAYAIVNERSLGSIVTTDKHVHEKAKNGLAIPNGRHKEKLTTNLTREIIPVR